MNAEPTSPIEAFLFDMGDVLIRFSHARMFAQVAEVLGKSPDEVRRCFSAPGAMTAYDRGDLSDDDMMMQMERIAGRPVDRKRLTRAVADIFESSPGMFEVLTELRRRGYR